MVGTVDRGDQDHILSIITDELLKEAGCQNSSAMHLLAAVVKVIALP